MTYLNLAAATMTGWSREDAAGRPLAEVFKIIDGTTHQAAPDPARRAIEEDKSVGLAMDCVLVRRDGFESPIENSAAPIHNRDGRVAGAVIALGRTFGHRVIAEGVEMQEQLAFLRTRQCDEGQGFHFSRPLAAEDFRRLLVTGNDEPPERWPG